MDKYIAIQDRPAGIPTTKVTNEINGHLRELNPVAETGQQDEFWGGTGGAGVLVKVTGNDTGGGKYVGQVFSPTPGTVSATTDLDSDDVGNTVGAALIMILNMAEEGQDTHDITEPTQVAAIFPAVKLQGVLSDHNPPREVYVINGHDAGNCSL